MRRVSWEQVRAFRARRHRLDERVPRRQMLRVVRELCGLHAQVLSSAELALWARVQGIEQGYVADALWKRRTLVKTWAMRGTLHLFAPADLPLWHGALSTYQHYLQPSWLRYFGIKPGQIELLTEAIGEALLGKVLTREELSAEVARRTGDPELGKKILQSWGSLLKPAAYLGRLCFAPGEPPRVRFTSPHTWVGERTPVPKQRALVEVTRRFLATHGPASQADFARWFGLRAAEAKIHLEDLGDEVAPLDAEGAKLFLLRRDLAELERTYPVASIRLLPAFDHYVVSATLHANHLMPKPLRARVYRPQGWLSPVLLANGRMDGVWRAERTSRKLLLTIEPFVKPSPEVRRGAEEEAVRLAAYHRATLQLRWA